MTGNHPKLRFETLADIVRHHGRERPEKVAFRFEGRDITYGALDRQSSRAANGLLALGLTRGERIVYLGKNCPEYWELVMAASKAGGVVAPINWRLAEREVAYIVNDAEARVLVIGPEFTGFAEKIRAQIPKIETVIVAEGNAGEFTPYAEWRDGQSADDPLVPLSASDDAVQMYTSGTTGHPKGAILSNHALLSGRARDQEPDAPGWARWDESDVSLIAMPCFHIGGTGWGVITLFFGAEGVIMREFDPLAVLDYIAKYRISKIFLVPAAMRIIVNQPNVRDIDYSQMKYIMYGASPMPLDLLTECMDVFGCGFVQMYGMTETSGAIAVLEAEDHDPAGGPRMKSVGRVLDGVDIAVLGAEGQALPVGEIGEIAIRSQSNMTGYWRLPEATRETLAGDGWLRTGDAGCLDADGYIFLHDRIKDMIISGGENVYPAEVETVIVEHPGVAEVAVIGVPDERWGESVMACIVPRPGEAVDEATIVAWCRERLAAYKCPKRVSVVDALPRNASGKVLRKDLRAPYWQSHERSIG